MRRTLVLVAALIAAATTATAAGTCRGMGPQCRAAAAATRQNAAAVRRAQRCNVSSSRRPRCGAAAQPASGANTEFRGVAPLH